MTKVFCCFTDCWRSGNAWETPALELGWGRCTGGNQRNYSFSLLSAHSVLVLFLVLSIFEASEHSYEGDTIIIPIL